MSSSTDNNNDAHSSGSNPFKRSRTSLPTSSLVIGTHSGTFQADEALGVWLLRQHPTYFNARVVRSRNPTVLEPLDIVIDVGGVYDHSKLRYDHHQRGYDERFTAKSVSKLSASGLVYRHYGKDVIAQLYPQLAQTQLQYAYDRMYGSFMEAIDAIDTGVEMIPPNCGVEALYTDRTNLSSRVSRLNARWNQDSDGDNNEDTRFELASTLCGEDFLGILMSIVESEMPARTFVEEALRKREEVHPTGEIIAFPSGGMPWRRHLYELEREHSVDPLVKFVLYTDTAGMWRVQAVTVEHTAFENRLSLPEEWRGVRDADLSSIAKIDGCTFCHAAGFIGGNKSYEGALEMAKFALTRK